MVGSWGLEHQTSTVSKQARSIDVYRSLPHRIDLLQLPKFINAHQQSEKLVLATISATSPEHTFSSSDRAELYPPCHI